MAESVHSAAGATSADDSVPLRRWFVLVALAVGIFSLVTSELLPVGLLTPIASALGVSEGHAGLMVTVPGLVAAVAAPLCAVAAGDYDRKRVLCALLGLLLTGNLLCACATSFGVLLAARVLVGISIGGFWAIAGGLAPRLVPAAFVGRAMAVIFAGVAVASVVGVPAGTALGEFGGWRSAFAVLGGLSCGVLLALVALLPPLPASQAITWSALAHVGTERAVFAGILATGLVVTGQFTAYTYMRPILQAVCGIGAQLVSAALLVYGVAGIVGNFLAGPAAARDVRRTLYIIVGALSLALLLLPVAGRGPLSGFVLVGCWGLAYGGVSVSLQTWMNRAAPQAVEAASAIFCAMFNLAIALGALLGGYLVDTLPVASVLWIGSAAVAAAGALAKRAPAALQKNIDQRASSVQS